jgi:hypothetical protein
VAVPVDIFVTDEAVLPAPIPGVEVGIFDVGTHTLVAGATTDVNGQASFMLPGAPDPGTQYEVRFFKLGVNFHGLRTISVLEPVGAEPNKFDHSGADSNTLPLSDSVTLCRCTGVFVDFSGRPIANKPIFFIAQGQNINKTPKVWDTPSRMVAPDTMEVRTDANGRVSVNLVRTGKFFVTFGGNDDTVWCITVPDACAVNLIDLIHPFPAAWDWDDTIAPGDAVSVAVDAIVEVPLSVIFTDFTQRGTALETYFDIINSDGTKVEASYDSSRGVLVLRGLAAGVATQTPTLKTGILPNRYPIPAVATPALTVTVT